MRLTPKTVYALPEETIEQLRSKESKLTILALRAFPSSPIQKEIQSERAKIQAKLAAMKS
jgi:hypothetical protein